MNKEKYIREAREFLDVAFDNLSYCYKKKLFLERLGKSELAELLYKYQNTTEEIDDDIYDEFIRKINEFGEIADFRVEYDDWEEANTYMVVFRDYPYYYAQEFDFDLEGDLQKAKDSISFWLNAVEERKAKLAEIVQYNKIIDVTEVEEWFLTHNHGDDMTFVDRFIANTGVEMDILEQTGFLHYVPKTHIYTNGTDFVKANHFSIKELDGEWHVVKPITIDEYKAR